ncbi:uncharacterized protein SPAPADRAFT_150718 [Spathaspora passalidarum NRRL Y-27907]|uniref:RRM domain-containing protein n=1 Tax=Spathaspora passalidarum (strain NRRL Y-27907 / 11-Y1) TaxID=619300 RepID=G3AL51_SPAPN|nr:uncharacterized protein SPAPADRAFT_150718 [Spathaspora passalidarum NRRL Y-27907]EGW33094.1 hypothetical protein SPAPADRAFT_150718 [Spathaspora passalidarum NRRL Y-27907]
MYQPVYYPGQQSRPVNHVPPPLHLQHSNLHNNIPQLPQANPGEIPYPQAMLPSTMFVSSPYFTPPPSARYVNHQHSFPPQSFQSSGVSSPRSSTSKSRSRPPSNMHTTTMTNSDEGEYKRTSPPYLAPLNNSTLSSRAYSSSAYDSLNHNIDRLNLSRTIILKNISEDVSLNDLLNEIDFGPIEYCKMFSKPTAKAIKDQDPEISDNLKVCYISFINSKVSILFHLKYKNSANLNELKKSLKNSKHLKIKFNETNNTNTNGTSNPNQDFIKLKTLNYIVEYNASRSILIKFSVNKELPEEVKQETRNEEIESFIKTQCGKFGEAEDFKIKIEDEEDSRVQGKVLVHFTSIDAAIKTYENYLRRIQHDTEQVVNNTEKTRNNSAKDEKDVNVKYDIKFTNVTFHKDRCDKTFIEGNTRNMSPESSNSSINHKHISSFQNIPEEIETNDDTSTNSTQLENFLTSPVLHEPSGLNIIEPISPNSSVIEGPQSVESPIHHESELIQEDVYEDNHHGEIPGMAHYDSYSFVSSDSRFSASMPHLIPIQAPQFNLVTPDMMSQSNVSSSSSIHYPIQPDPLNIGNRTIYLGNLHPNTTVEEIANNVRAGGLVESINHRPDKKVCFITFVDANVAFKFYLNHQVLHQLIIHGYDVTVGWAKQHSGPLSHEIGLAVTAGASRNIYIGIRVNKNQPADKEKPRLPDENQLRMDFSKFGLLEQINFYHNKDCGFLNFLNIRDAIKLVEIFDCEESLAISKLRRMFKNFESEEDTAAFYNKYKQFKISFAKDRCGNPPKFSYKKKVPGSFGSSYQLQSFNGSENGIIDTNMRRHRKLRKNPEDYDEKTRMNEADIYMEQTINEEAAMVFGIISNQEKAKTDDKEQDSSDAEINGDAHTELELAREVEAINIGNGELNGEAIENGKEEEDSDDDDDEEVSIIIGSDDVAELVSNNESKKTDAPIKKNKGRSRRNKQNRQNVYRKRFNQSDISMPLGSNSASSSTLSLNSSFMNYNPPQNFTTATTPYGQSQPHQTSYFMPLSRNSSSSNIRKGYYSHTPSIVPEYYHIQPPPIYYQQVATPTLPHQKKFADGSAPQINKNPYFFSGSQVMAQYLAKARNENLFYVPTWLANDVEVDQDQIFEESGNLRLNNGTNPYIPGSRH